MSDLTRLLMRFGFEEVEAQLYLLLFKRGSSSAEELSSESNRSLFSVQAAMMSLMTRGIVSTYQSEVKKLYSAESLEVVFRHLETDADQRAKDLETFRMKITEIESEKGSIGKVRFFEGKQGIMTMIDDFLSSGVDRAYEFFPRDAVLRVFSKAESERVSGKRKRSGMFVKALYTSNDRFDFPEDSTRYCVQINQKDYPMNADIIIYGSKVIMASLSGELSGVIVESDSIATSLRSIFSLAFKAAENEKTQGHIDKQ